jgi:hypothetical protein
MSDSSNALPPIQSTHWQVFHEAQSAMPLDTAVSQVFTQVYNDDFADAMMGINHRLSVDLRGWQEGEQWKEVWLLTPWMLSRVFFPMTADVLADKSLPEDWQAESRLDQPYCVIGPLMPILIDGKAIQTHLNYHPLLGHYWIQPLVQNMMKYADNESAYQAWGEVIAFRNAVRAQKQAELEAKEQAAKVAEATIENKVEVNRRAFLSKWL